MSGIIGIGCLSLDVCMFFPDIVKWDEQASAKKFHIQQGGMTATAAAAASILGAQSELVCGVGNDDFLEYHKSVFRKNRLKYDRIKIFDGEFSQVTSVLVNSEDGRRALYQYRGISDCDDIGFIDISDADLLLLDGFFFETEFRAAKDAKEKGIPIVTDISPQNKHPKLMEFLALIDFPVLSHLFVQAYTGLRDPLEGALKLYSDSNKAMIVTCGADGAYIVTNEGVEHFPTYDVDVMDSTGAGDVFHGAFAFAIWKGYGIKEAVKFSNATSSIKCMRQGGQIAIPSYDEVCQFLEEREKDSKLWIIK